MTKKGKVEYNERKDFTWSRRRRQGKKCGEYDEKKTSRRPEQGGQIREEKIKFNFSKETRRNNLSWIANSYDTNFVFTLTVSKLFRLNMNSTRDHWFIHWYFGDKRNVLELNSVTVVTTRKPVCTVMQFRTKTFPLGNNFRK